MATTPTGWEGIFADGESVLWQGRPRGGILWSDLIRFESVFGLFFGGFAIFWVFGAATMARMTHSGSSFDLIGSLFPLFGLPFVAVGLYMLVGRIFWDAYARRRTWYTLSNRAAYIATDTLGKRKLRRIGFDDMVAPSLDDGTPGSVWFAEDIRNYTTRRRSSSGMTMGTARRQSVRVPVGFRQIDDARQVYRLIVQHRDAES
ncbi:MAG: hypothetical protein H6900_08465 [Rhodobacter sp.]|uniref:hypothetical protein n=1 Tax=Pararhodobacter sp. TaxID=2127056 RepID=UPI001D3BE416|nr:hypothetical protein [Pararhodobacter sp.]MCB1346746.1 hypothetical protein [Paracoccaceae bacterium]MCC0073309.1 hypothetical protein [Rhodobacter sp.]HPD91220.1 hypothetical protein [Pararhodobacter sp.]